ncbi:hypothetical protein [Paenibacillus macerans]|uniref:hypothetical protein n=1 Tax=Paenibacillus macerans TaxID=44252 RepID=UPI00203ACA78|nr:hypothetical protein [Paenibacillus macerans]MCM3700149.1 hypothetical protein [Paenibacillus macerans]
MDRWTGGWIVRRLEARRMLGDWAAKRAGRKNSGKKCRYSFNLLPIQENKGKLCRYLSDNVEKCQFSRGCSKNRDKIFRYLRSKPSGKKITP